MRTRTQTPEEYRRKHRDRMTCKRQDCPSPGSMFAVETSASHDGVVHETWSYRCGHRWMRAVGRLLTDDEIREIERETAERLYRHTATALVCT